MQPRCHAVIASSNELVSRTADNIRDVHNSVYSPDERFYFELHIKHVKRINISLIINEIRGVILCGRVQHRRRITAAEFVESDDCKMILSF